MLFASGSQINDKPYHNHFRYHGHRQIKHISLCHSYFGKRIATTTHTIIDNTLKTTPTQPWFEKNTRLAKTAP
jgi:hypothetical protein